MSPTLKDGDYVVTNKPRSIRPGFIYVIDHIDLGRIIKRLNRVENGRYHFVGDGELSVPEAIIAPVSKERIKAEARWAIGPQGFRRLKT